MKLPPLTVNGWLRYAVVEQLLRGVEGVGTVLEIGAGEGAMGTRLAQRFSYVGVELDARSFAVASSRMARTGNGTVVQGDVGLVLRDTTFDLVCAFEVLEHLEDDRAALVTWRRYVRAGGWLMLSVPAFGHRFGESDRAVGHYRRYEPDELRTLLLDAGFVDPVLRTYGYPHGYALEWARNLIARRRGRGATMAARTAASGRFLQPPEILGGVTRALTAPFRLLQRGSPNCTRGTGLVTLARRPPPGRLREAEQLL